ncbi:ankyrin repeat domain-containing protein [Desulfuromonas acetexigens]|nr:ankyrin repeat domain-containing protein [Desulfuromonas acetexigens]
MKPDISPRYYIAETTIWLLGAIIAISRFVGLAPFQSLPVLNVTLRSQQHSFRVVAAMLAAATFYLIFEWKQSPQEARNSYWAQSRAGITIIFSCVSLWLSYPFIAANTRFAGISPAWYFSFCSIGFLLGLFGSTLALSSIMIRTPAEARAINLPRMPTATRSQYMLSIPIISILIVAYYLLCYKAPEVMIGQAYFFVAVPFVYLIGAMFTSLCLKRDDDGNRIPYGKSIASLKKSFDLHDYSYYLIDHGQTIAGKYDIRSNESPEEIQRAMQEEFCLEASSSMRFHVKQLEEFQIEFYSKDGNSNNNTPENRGIRIHKSQGKKGFLRVQVISDEPENESREMDIPAALVVTYAEKYLLAHTENEDLTTRKVFSYAINQTVIHTMEQELEPLLQRVVLAGQTDQVEDLLNQDVDVNEQTAIGWTALLAAAAQGYPQIVQLLLDAGANTDIGNLKGITPLIYGARYGNIEVSKLLLEYGANPNLQDTYGMTALMIATRYGFSDIVEMLLKAGANTKIKDHDAMTAIDFAHKYKHGKIAKMLRTANQRQDRP